jgi:uncharacterized membrane protein YbjE (DUF340 family)
MSQVPALRRLPSTRAFAAARTGLLCAMVAAMGFRIGRTRAVIENAGTLGLSALVFAAAAMAGTLLVLTVVFALRRTNRDGMHDGDRREAPGLASALFDPLLLAGALGAGLLVGLLVPVFPAATGEQLVTGLLYALLVVVGLGLGASGVPELQVLTHPDLLLIPLGAAAGTLIGGLAAGLAMGMRPGPSMSVAAGFGWYSLSGVILTRLDSPSLGAVSFLSNLLRETMAMVLIPLLARTRFPLLAIGAGGATSMDVTLPLIEKSCGARAVPFSIASGGLLSLSVPFLVPLFYSL